MNPHDEFIDDGVSGTMVKNKRYLDYEAGAKDERERIFQLGDFLLTGYKTPMAYEVVKQFLKALEGETKE